MDDYRPYLKNTQVTPISALLGEDSAAKDDQTVCVAGIVQSVRMKTTRNNSMMAYVTLEDDTAAMELLAFSNVLSQFGGHLKENLAVVVTGRLSVREDKDPQILVNEVRLLLDYAESAVGQKTPANKGKLYLRLETQACLALRKTRAILNMFPGIDPVVLYFADTGKRWGSNCSLDNRMLEELKNLLGEGNVVLKQLSF